VVSEFVPFDPIQNHRAVVDRIWMKEPIAVQEVADQDCNQEPPPTQPRNRPLYHDIEKWRHCVEEDLNRERPIRLIENDSIRVLVGFDENEQTRDALRGSDGSFQIDKRANGDADLEEWENSQGTIAVVVPETRANANRVAVRYEGLGDQVSAQREKEEYRDVTERINQKAKVWPREYVSPFQGDVAQRNGKRGETAQDEKVVRRSGALSHGKGNLKLDFTSRIPAGSLSKSRRRIEFPNTDGTISGDPGP